MRRNFWLIPLFFMGLAMLACSLPRYDPVQVHAVQADPQIAGKAYIVVAGNVFRRSSYERDERQAVYETTDYGETWHPSNHPIFAKGTPDRYGTSDQATPTKSAKFFWSDGTLYRVTEGEKGIPLWSFPRGTFRYFFLPDISPYFMMDYYPDYDVSVADPTVIYISLGTEGVLVGPNPDHAGTTPRAWRFSHNGIDILTTLPLTITDPGTILGIIALGLFLPPLSILHFWLLAQVYRYAFQPGERFAPYKLAGIVTGIITLLAALAIYVWLTDVNTDYYPIVGVMTLVCVVLGVGTGVWISRQRNFSTLFVRRMAWASALVSVVVPAGVASVYGLWPFIVCGVLAFGLYRHAIERRATKQGLITSRWALDRITRTFTLFAVWMGYTSIAWLMTMLYSAKSYGSHSDAEGQFIACALFLWLPIGTALNILTRRRSSQFLSKKKTDGVSSEPLFVGWKWYCSLMAHTAVWLFLSIGFTYVVLILQYQAQDWFQTLLTNYP